jgi:hypothetical protein
MGWVSSVVVFPGIGYSIEVVVLDTNTRPAAYTNAVTAGHKIAVVIVIDMDLAVTYARHSFLTHSSPPVMVKSNAKVICIVLLGITGSDEIYEVMGGIRGIVELAPRNGNIVGIVGYIETAVAAIIESALGDKDIVYILRYAHTVILASYVRIGDVQILNDYIPITIFKVDISYERWILTYTSEGFVSANFENTGTNIDSTRDLNNIWCSSQFGIIFKVCGVVDINNSSALAACGAAVHTGPAVCGEHRKCQPKQQNYESHQESCSAHFDTFLQ